MATKKKLLQAAAGSAGGAGGLDVSEVFSTYLYEGNDSTQTITNGIDLSGEGGLVWLKARDAGQTHLLFDTERGTGPFLRSNEGNAEQTDVGYHLSSYNSDGFSLQGNGGGSNNSSYDYASWVFRKSKGFFECVTYTGNGTAGRTISHNLGTTVGCMLIKNRSNTGGIPWSVYHKDMDTNPTQAARYVMELNTSNARNFQDNIFNGTAPTSTEFTVGTDNSTNQNGDTYVAYLFAHNDGDASFGPTGDQNIIKCGRYSGNAPSSQDIDLGFEPQWILVKPVQAGSWVIYDNARGWVGYGYTRRLQADTTNTEADENGLVITPTGFQATADSNYNNNTQDYIYIAIRRGPMAVPESATDVFDVTAKTTGSNQITTVNSGFSTDLSLISPGRNGGFFTHDRLRGELNWLRTSSTASETTETGYPVEFDHQDGIVDKFSGASQTACYWQWRRAPSFCDVVAYTGNGTTRTINHNLGVAPEMMIVKSRNANAGWMYYHAGAGNTKALWVDSSVYNPPQFHTDSGWWGNTTPSDTSFTLGINTNVNASGYTYIAYLFASLDGVSKVGSYTGNGTSQTIDCGFSSGARFVLIFREDSASDIHVWDSERGIVAGNDGYLELNTSDAENTSYDNIDPDSSGFIVNEAAGADINGSGNTYLFYAIA